MTAEKEALEAAARAIYELNPIELAGEHIDGFKVSPDVIASWDDFAEWFEPDPRDAYRAEAQAAVTAYLAHRAEAGWRMMPREPTPGMIQAGMDECRRSVQGQTMLQAIWVYQGMYAALDVGGEDGR